MSATRSAPETLTYYSLPVASVQELALRQPETVPPRYIRDGDIGDVNPSAGDCDRVPLIDMSKLLLNSDSQAEELQRLHSVCKDWAVFQLINHGIPDELLRKMEEQAQEFFDLPLEEKKRWAQKPGSLEGYGQAFVNSQEQKLDWYDMIFLKALPTHIRNLDLWPQQPPKFRETLETYSENMKRVAVSLIKLMGMALELEGDEEMSSAYKEGGYEVRMNFYPPCPEPERVMGLSKHVDICGITLLLQSSDTPGLQVLRNDGQWVTVLPIDGAIVVNIGCIVQVMSNGIYKAPEHRAIVNRWKERLSIATFCFPNSSVNIGPAKELLAKSATPPLYKTLSYPDYRSMYYKSRRLNLSFTDMLKI